MTELRRLQAEWEQAWAIEDDARINGRPNLDACRRTYCDARDRYYAALDRERGTLGDIADRLEQSK